MKIENWILIVMAVALCAASFQAVAYKGQIKHLQGQIANHEHCVDWCVEQWTEYGC